MKINSKSILKDEEIDLNDWSDVKDSVGLIEDQAIEEVYKAIQKQNKLSDEDMDILDVILEIKLEPIGDESKVEELIDEDGEEYYEDPRPVKISILAELQKFESDHSDKKKTILSETAKSDKTISNGSNLCKEIDKLLSNLDSKLAKGYK